MSDEKEIEMVQEEVVEQAPEVIEEVETKPLAHKSLTGLKAKIPFHGSVHNGAILDSHFEIDAGDDLSAIPDCFYDFLKENGVI